MSTQVVAAPRIGARPEIASRSLLDQRRTLAMWALAFVAIIAMYAAIWPTVKGNTQWRQLFDTLPESYRALFTAGGQIDLSTPSGYLGVELLSFVGPTLIAIYAVVAGSAAIAGEEDRGILELTLSAPVSRTRVLAERFAALLAGITLLMAALAGGLWLFSAIFDMGLGLAAIAACGGALGLFGLFVGSVALAVGAATGRPALARGTAALVAVASYLVNALGQLTDALEPGRPFSPYYLVLGNDPLSNGLAAGRCLAVAAVSVALVAVAALALRRRDLSA
jgi:beta-exotoxin I transport system permease protein